MATTNPAQRLRDILVIALAQQRGESIQRAWARTFSIPEMDRMRLTRALIDLQALIDGIREQVRTLDEEDVSDYLDTLPSLERVLFPVNWGAQWSEVTNALDPGIQTQLQMCARMLRNYSEEVIPDEELARLRAEVEALIQSVMDAKLPREVERVILDLLKTAQDALLNYRLRGAEGVRQAVMFSMGAMFTVARYSPELTKDILWERLVNLVKDIDSVTSFGTKLVPLMTPVANLLMQLGPPH